MVGSWLHDDGFLKRIGGMELIVVCSNRLLACPIAIMQAYSMAMLHSWLVAMSHACIKVMLHVRTIAFVVACIVTVIRTRTTQQVRIIGRDLSEHLGPLRQY